MSPPHALFMCELRLAWSGGGGAAGPAAFLLAALTLVPLAMGPAPDLIAAAGPGVISFALLLACWQPAERLFGDDASDGTLEVYVLSGQSLTLIGLIKTLAFLVAVFWPAPALIALAGIAYGLSGEAVFALTLALTLALPGLVLISAFAASLAAGLKRAGLLIALIAAPLQIPVLVFASGAARAAETSMGSVTAHFLLTASASLIALVLAPVGMGWAIKSRLE